MAGTTGSGWAVGIGSILCALAVHAHDPSSPFASSVMEYVPGIGLPFDSITGAPFHDPTRALGPPTIDTTGDGFLVSPFDPLPVTPAYPAFRGTELVSIGVGGQLTLAFDAPVLDHPLNPFGLDFIVFGNAWLSVNTPGAYGTNDPNSVLLGAYLAEEPGRVSVSADGAQWFTFTEPFADSFAPALGRRYQPDAPDVGLGAWNQWWGSPTDPTRPLDPAIAAGDLAGRSLAEAALVYGTSAGGAGFDIGTFDLPLDPDTGLKYIRYVRIENPSETATPEIDAVARIAPVSRFEAWTLRRFHWQQRMNAALLDPAADPDGDGVPNLLEFLFDRDPMLPDPSPLFSVTVLHTNRHDLLLVQYRILDPHPEYAVRVEHSLDYLEWTRDNVDQHFAATASGSGWLSCTAALVATHAHGAFRLVAEGVTP